MSDWYTLRENLPSDEDEPFVLRHLVVAKSHLLSEQDLKIVVSTSRLLQNADKSDMVQADATYKIVWQGYPVLIIGTRDMSRTFHPYTLTIDDRRFSVHL